MARYSNYLSENWDEDGYLERDTELEYYEDWEEEDDEYFDQYSPVQGNWDPRDFEDDKGFEKITRRSKSVLTYTEQRERNHNTNRHDQRKNAKAKEKQRQKYYHYTDDVD